RVVQTSGTTCGPAAAAMLLRRYGIEAGEGEMAYLAGTSLFGSDAHALARALEAKAGLRAQGGRTRWEARQGAPFIAHVRGASLGHAVLVERLDERGATITDPAGGGTRRMARGEFERAWDGTAVWISGSRIGEPSLPARGTMADEGRMRRWPTRPPACWIVCGCRRTPTPGRAWWSCTRRSSRRGWRGWG
ncbi:MAG: hypothetical protein K2W96_20040, partial [Gemmataceae bacterium]|nr:hypothetical protein [Gemmataceae bacterium]